ncbi:MAG: DUF4230 domain-containing protein [Oscillospiraceae bacterium]|nr:DUF4230 domain-containing protein [Oscillospiraceae bacterium]
MKLWHSKKKQLPAEAQNDSAVPAAVSEKKGSWIIPAIFLALVIVMVGVIIWQFESAISIGAKAISDSYQTARNQTTADVYDSFYTAAEEYYHTTNDITIDIDSVCKVAQLEVLQVSDVEYVLQKGSNDNDNITAWLEVPGTGMFTVNLEASEFIVDSERQYVLVTLPQPVLSQCTIDRANIEKLRFGNNIFNDSVKAGEELLQQQLEEGEALIRQSFSSNPQLLESARNAARSLVTGLVKSFNPDCPELVVEVEFAQ